MRQDQPTSYYFIFILFDNQPFVTLGVVSCRLKENRKDNDHIEDKTSFLIFKFKIEWHQRNQRRDLVS